MAMSIAAYGQSRNVLDSTSHTASRLYDKADYVGAELEARRALETVSMADSMRIEFERIIAFALVAQGKNNTAAEHFIQILSMDQSFDLDPVLTSPKILEVFQQAKKKFFETQHIGREQQAPVILNELPMISYRAVLFPGWEQLHQGRKTKGWTFLSAGILALGSALTFDLAKDSYHTKYLAATDPDVISSRYATYNRCYKGERYSLYSFIALYLYSELDAFLFLPEGDALHSDFSSPWNNGATLSLRVPLH
jgi:hypothetical protein